MVMKIFQHYASSATMITPRHRQDPRRI